jgi:hypothetical protein
MLKKKYAGILTTSSENLCNITKKIVKDKFLLLKFYKTIFLLLLAH